MNREQELKILMGKELKRIREAQGEDVKTNTIVEELGGSKGLYKNESGVSFPTKKTLSLLIGDEKYGEGGLYTVTPVERKQLWDMKKEMNKIRQQAKTNYKGKGY